jgi:hypothetical protein
MSRSSVIAAPVLLCAMTLAACGSAGQNPSGKPASGSGASGAGGTATPAAPASSVPAATGGSARASAGGQAAACATARLTITVDTRQGSAAAGSAYYPIDFTSTSGSPCTLFGYPGVSFVTRPGGSQLGSPATRNSGAPAGQVTLPAGGHAHAVLQVVSAGNYSASDCHPVTAHWLRVYPPGQTEPGYAAFTAQVCSAKLPATLGSSLSVFPVRGGEGQLGGAP